MKLLCCHQCSDVFSISTEKWKFCSCGVVRGMYTDSLNAEVYGPEGRYSVLGFANSSLIDAIKKQKELGDPAGWHGYVFKAFIIPEKADSVTRINT